MAPRALSTDWFSQRYHRGAALRLARHVLNAQGRILLVEPPHDTYLEVLPREELTVLTSNPIRAARLRDRFPAARILEGDPEEIELEGPFRYILIPGLLSQSERLWEQLRRASAGWCDPRTRLLLLHYSFLWEPAVKLAQAMGFRRPHRPQNWLAPGEVARLLTLTGLEVIRVDRFHLIPLHLGGWTELVNRYLAPLPLLQHLCFHHLSVVRPRLRPEEAREHSVTVVVPTRNERGNIRPAVESIPELGSGTEILFIDGASNDGTVEAIQEEMERWKGRRNIRLVHQVEPGELDESERQGGRMLKLGKGHAVRKAFDEASGELLMILDGDLTVPPDSLHHFYQAYREGHGELINGNRLVYPQEKQAMRLLNLLANKCFGYLFTYLLGQRLTDTLCGTKVIHRDDYRDLIRNRSYFGDFDPFGDFDLLFGAARLNLKITEVFVRYRERSYGDIKIQRFRHGLLLVKMSWIAFRRLKLGT